MKSVEDRVLKRIRGMGKGSVFTSRQFFDVADPPAVNKALSRLAHRGAIRHLARGLYDCPKTHPVLGILPPSMDNVVKALSAKYGIRVQPTGAYAANLLCLSEQVPVRIALLTDGPSRVISVGNQQIHFRHTSLMNMATAGTVSGLVIQALLHLGPRYVGDRVVRILRRTLKDRDKKKLLADIIYAPAWVAPYLRKIAS